MERIIFVPQYPSNLRYQEWWITKLAEEFRKRNFEVIVIGEDYISNIKNIKSALDMFSPINEAIRFETSQINEYMNLELKEDDILFLADLSFPGIFTNVLFHKKPKKCFAFCHATSINKFDYFEKNKANKFMIETAIAYLFDIVFIGSKYHRDKLKWINTKVTYLPFPPMNPSIINEKTIDIMSASRPSIQKVDINLEIKVEKRFNLKIQRPINNSWEEYYDNLAKSKILIITALEDTFGYQIVDAILNGCIPIARNSFAYPELLDDRYLYNNEEQLYNKIESILNGEFTEVPKLLCEEGMNNFYDTICNEMKG